MPRMPLFVPGGDAVRTPKAYAIAVDAVIMDLEDAVADAEKPAARRHVRETVGAMAEERIESWVRVNSLASGLVEDDLAAVVVDGLAGVVLPMAETAGDVETVARQLDSAERDAGLTAGSTRIIPIVETAAGFLEATRIMAASPRVCAGMFGPGDFTLDLGIELTREGAELDVVRTLFPIYCRAAGGIPAIDGAYPFFDDLDGFRRTSENGKAMGYKGRTALHPSQLDVVRQVYRVSERERAWARRVIDVFDAAVAEGRASVRTPEGDFVDYPIAARARALLEQHRQLETEELR